MREEPKPHTLTNAASSRLSRDQAMIQMRYVAILVVVTFVAATTISQLTFAEPDGSKELPKGVAAKVGKYTVTSDDILKRIYDVESPMTSKDKHLQHAYSYLMELNLLRCEADTLGIKVKEQDRKDATKQQLDAIKKRVAREYNNAMPWDKWLEQQGYTEKSFYDYIYERSEPIVLKQRVVLYFELTQPSVTYSEIRLGNYNALLKIKEKLDAGDDFDKTALLNSVTGTAGVKVAYKEQGLPRTVEKTLFETLKPTEYSEILSVADKDYRIVMLKSRSKGSNKSYSDLKDKVLELSEKNGDVDADRFARWVAVIYNTGRYPVKYRFPGEKTKSASTSPE